MTRMPVIFSCTVRTTLSKTDCCFVYSGRLCFVTKYTTTAMMGSRQISTSASGASILSIINIPPTSRIGARMPMRWILASIWLML